MQKRPDVGQPITRLCLWRLIHKLNDKARKNASVLVCMFDRASEFLMGQFLRQRAREMKQMVTEHHAR